MTDEMKALAKDSPLLRAVYADLFDAANVEWERSEEPDITETEKLSRQAKSLGISASCRIVGELCVGRYDA